MLVHAHDRLKARASKVSASNNTKPSTSAASTHEKEETSTPSYNLFTSQPAVAAATPSPSAIEKDFSGFGDTDDDFAVDDID